MTNLRVREYLDFGESMEHGFDTKLRRHIEMAVDQLRALAKKDDAKSRKHEQDVIDGLIRANKSQPNKFVYSMLEIFGARGAYKSKRYGAKD